MNRLFTSFILASVIFCSATAAAQETADDFYTKARKFLNQGNFDSATFYMDKALEISPERLDMLEDQVYLEIVKRDFAKAMTLGNKLITRSDATVKTFQVVGMVYKEIADYKSGKKLYEQGLAKYPNSGLLYADFGDMYAMMDKEQDAIRTWEKGIEMDPGYAGNYYYATLHYKNNNNPLWALLYAENFINIESFSGRTAEMKGILTDLYKKISTPGYLLSRNNPFAFAVAGTFTRQPSLGINSISVPALTSLRMGFINDWNQQNATKIPFKLFEYHDQLIKEGLFEAYNQWLFGAALNVDAFTAWSEGNKEQVAAFQKALASRMFKVPAGQYYQTRP